jgi:hypothetical protein
VLGSVLAGPLAALLDVLAGQVERDPRGVDPDTAQRAVSNPVTFAGPVAGKTDHDDGRSSSATSDRVPGASNGCSQATANGPLKITAERAAGCGPGVRPGWRLGRLGR